MRKLNLIFVAVAFVTASIIGQDTDMPGQGFDLEAFAGLIETVSTFEDLEKAINTQSNEVNNLDQDKNGEVDYVIIQMENVGDTYVAFLRVPLSESTMMDVASIEMEKQSSVTASFQIVGDEALYGKDYILEPEGGLVDISESSSGSTGGKGGPSFSYIPPPPAFRVTICVGVYRPGFRVFVSPYGFRVYPVWFHPWRPLARNYYRARAARWHRARYHRAAHYRSHNARSMHKKHYNSNKAAHYNSSPSKKTNNSTNNKNYNSSNSKSKQNSAPSNRNAQTKTTQQKGTAPKTTQPKNSGGAKPRKK